MPSTTLTPPAETVSPNPQLKAGALNIGFLHLGCPKNLVDTETMLGLLQAEGHRIVADEADADLMLVNTCAFIDEAQKESVQSLVRLAEAGKRLLIAGCLAQKFKEELLDLFPEADAVVGIHNVEEVASIVHRVQQGERVLAMQQNPTYVLSDDRKRRHISVGASVYVKVSEGCDYRCKFCIIPSMRGDLRSRPVANIVDSVKALVDEGVSEIVLVGQDNTSYGRDLGTDLPELLETLNRIEGLQWLRFLYAYPNNRLNERLLKTIRDCDKVVKYLDCPLQHSHPDMLKRMARPGALPNRDGDLVLDTEAWAEWVRETVPGIKLRTTFIVGFPGETEAEYQHLKQTIERVEFDRLGVFEYSDVEGAASTALGDKVTKATMKARRNELMALQQGISYRHNQAMMGQRVEVLIDEIRPSGMSVGRTQWDAPEIDNQVLVQAKGAEGIVPGQIVPVQVAQVTPYDLKGRVVAG
jgi:ribosomal protein S12 methylthiotransferase